MNKRAFLLGEETVKIIIAVIAIGFLVYLLYALYASNVGNEKRAQAQALLFESESGSLEAVLDRLETTSGSEEFLLHSPTGWTFFTYLSSEKKPNSCLGFACACICDEVTFDSIPLIADNRQLTACDEDGACLVIEELVGDKLSQDIDGGSMLEINRSATGVRITLS